MRPKIAIAKRRGQEMELIAHIPEALVKPRGARIAPLNCQGVQVYFDTWHLNYEEFDQPLTKVPDIEEWRGSILEKIPHYNRYKVHRSYDGEVVELEGSTLYYPREVNK